MERYSLNFDEDLNSGAITVYINDDNRLAVPIIRNDGVMKVATCGRVALINSKGVSFVDEAMRETAIEKAQSFLESLR